MTLAILEPEGNGLSQDQLRWMPSLIQGSMTGDFNLYSAITIIDRQNLETVLDQQGMSMTGHFSDDDFIRIGHIANARYVLAGTVTRTATAYMLEFAVTDVQTGVRRASRPPTQTSIQEIENLSAVREATVDLLGQLGVTLTGRGRQELTRVPEAATVQAQTALARGIYAQRQGMEVEALSHFMQANSFDPLLMEAETRLNITSAAFHRGNLGADARGDIQWRNQWIGRLRETEEFVAQFLRQSPAFYLVYSFYDGELAIDFARETVTKIVELRSLPEPNWFMAMNQLVGAVRGALLATGRADTWGLSWPTQSISTPSPFTGSNTTYAVVVEILNVNGISIAQQTVNLPFDWFIPHGAERAGTMVPRVQFNPSRVSFPNIDVNIIDDLDIRIVSINNIGTESAVPQLGIRALPEHEFNRIRSVTDNGLRTDNLRQFDVRFGHNHNRVYGYSGYSTSIVIPFGVSRIDQNSGLRDRGLTSVRMPSSLVQIGANTWAFHYRIGALQGNRLTSVIIPDSVTYISYWAFNGNPLTRVTIGADVQLRRGGQVGASSSASFPSSITGGWRYDFFHVYNNNGRRAGTYVNTGGTNWAFSGQ